MSRLCDLQKEIATFLRQKILPYTDQFFDPRWLARLALLTDITRHLNALIVKLQGKNMLVTDMHAHITAFEVKLRLWEAQLANGLLEHFPRLAACVPDDVEPDTCVSVVASLRKEFASRFAGIRPLAADFKLFVGPFDFHVYEALAPLQMQLVELQCNEELKAKCYNSSTLSLFGDIALPFLNTLRMFNASQPCLAASRPYCCEQLFSKTKYTKSRIRSLLSGRHLNDIILLSSSSIEPDIEILLHGKQNQPSH